MHSECEMNYELAYERISRRKTSKYTKVNTHVAATDHTSPDKFILPFLTTANSFNHITPPSDIISITQFLPARRYASASTSYVPVSVYPSQVGVLLKRLDGSSWFLARGFFRPILHGVVKKFRYVEK